jgi:hypothetical protein
MQAHPTRRRAIICGRGAQPASSLRHVGGAPRTQGEPGHKRLSPSAVILATWSPKMYREHGDAPKSVFTFRLPDPAMP